MCSTRNKGIERVVYVGGGCAGGMNLKIEIITVPPRKRSFFDAPFFVIIWHHKANVEVARYTEQWATALKLLPMMLYGYGEAVLKLRQDGGLTDTLEIAIFSINITMVSCTMTAKEKICRQIMEWLNCTKCKTCRKCKCRKQGKRDKCNINRR